MGSATESSPQLVAGIVVKETAEAGSGFSRQMEVVNQENPKAFWAEKEIADSFNCQKCTNFFILTNGPEDSIAETLTYTDFAEWFDLTLACFTGSDSVAYNCWKASAFSLNTSSQKSIVRQYIYKELISTFLAPGTWAGQWWGLWMRASEEMAGSTTALQL